MSRDLFTTPMPFRRRGGSPKKAEEKGVILQDFLRACLLLLVGALKLICLATNATGNSISQIIKMLTRVKKMSMVIFKRSGTQFV